MTRTTRRAFSNTSVASGKQENVGTLLNRMGAFVTKDTEKAESKNDFLLQSLLLRLALRNLRPLRQERKSGERRTSSWLRMIGLEITVYWKKKIRLEKERKWQNILLPRPRSLINCKSFPEWWIWLWKKHRWFYFSDKQLHTCSAASSVFREEIRKEKQ